MSTLSKILRGTENNGLTFWCPGCDGAHRIQHGAGPGPRWGWNGDVNKPTFTPSVLVSYDHLSEASRLKTVAFRAEHGRFMTREELPYDAHVVCHSFVTDGRIQFLSDCTHSLAGQTVDIPEFDS